MAQDDKAGAVLRDSCYLKKLPGFAGLPEHTREDLAVNCRVRRFHAGQVVAHAGEEPEFIGCVLRGVLRMQKAFHDGRQHLVGLLLEGDMFGQMSGGPLNISIEAAADCEVCTFQRAPFEALLQRSPELDRVLLLNTLNELDRARDWMIVLANPRVKGRLASVLLIFCTRFAGIDHLLRPANGTVDVKIPIGRTDLAHLLGTRPETISRAFHALADGGSIAIKKPDLIEIRDFDALRAETGEEDAGIHPPLKDLTRRLQDRIK